MHEPVSVAVIGAGVMGRGIAQVMACAGLETRLFDASAEQLREALARVQNSMTRAVDRGLLDAAVRDRALQQLRGETDPEQAARDVDLVIEAVPERMELKVEVLRAAAEVARPDATLASNTSSLSITTLGARCGLSSRVIGMHFFNPPPKMALLEVVRGAASDDAHVHRALALAERLGKQPIEVKDAPGFASSRLGLVLGAEAIRMVESGVASPRDIDRAMKLGYGHPMGPLQLTDLVGLDVRLAILEYLHGELGEAFAPPELLRRMVAEGKLGKKSGLGFYRWTEAGAELP